MKLNHLILILIFLAFPSVANSQHLHSVNHLDDLTRQELTEQLGMDVDNGVKFYKMTYHTTGSDGLPDIASGLIVLPDNSPSDQSLVIYHHGTSPAKDLVPSSLNLDYEAYAYIGGNGFAVIAPDYLGMGDSRGFHPYVHRETQASASVDMLKAFHEWADQESVLLSEKLFLTGYSQGGHASMSAHQLLEDQYSEEFPVTAAAHLSGPYSLSQVMKDVITSEEDYLFPGFIPYTILGFQEVYGDVYIELSDIFRDIFIFHIESFYNGSYTLTQLSVIMSLIMQQQYGNSHPVNILNPELAEELRNNPDHRFNQLLAENDTHNWTPQAPTRLFYCQADDLVPFENSVVAYEAFQGNGAVDLQLTDINPALNHGDCAEPAIIAAIDFFNGFQETQVQPITDISTISFYPNPTRDFLQIEVTDINSFQFRLYDISGRLIKSDITQNTVNLSQLGNGVYIMMIDNGQQSATRKIIKF